MYYAHVPDSDWQDYHIGDRLDLEREDDKIPSIEYVQADGHELSLIVEMFGDTIPMPRGPMVIRWYGDIAKTIHFALITHRGFGVFQ